MLAAEDLKPIKNQERDWLEEEEDTFEDRQYFWIDQCPKGGCSKDSFKRANVWSYESEDQVRRYLVHHLIHSSSHEMKGPDAKSLAFETSVDFQFESRESRDQSRAEYAEHQKAQQGSQKRQKTSQAATSGKCTPSGGKGEGKRVAELEQQIKDLRRTVEQQARGQAAASSSTDIVDLSPQQRRLIKLIGW